MICNTRSTLFAPLRLVGASLLFSSLVISPVDVRASEADDIAAILGYLSRWDVAANAGTVPFVFPGGSTLGEWMMYYFGTGPNGIPTFWSQLSALIPQHDTNVVAILDDMRSYYLSSIMSDVSSLENNLLQAYYELDHQHEDVEDILDILSYNRDRDDDWQTATSNLLDHIDEMVSDIDDLLWDASSGPGSGSAYTPPASDDPEIPDEIDSDVLDTEEASGLTLDIEADVDVDYSASFQSSTVLTLWEPVEIGGYRIRGAQIDLGNSMLSEYSSTLYDVCGTFYYFLYYLAIFWLVRREYTYYASLGHTQEG